MTLMKRGLKFGILAPALAVGLMASAPASAAGLGGLSTVGSVDVAKTSNLIEVQNRRRGRGRVGRRGRGRAAPNFRRGPAVNYRRKARRRKNRNLAIGLGLGILGAAVLSNRHYNRPRTYNRSSYAYGGRGGYKAAKKRCARHFEDYSWRTDLIYDEYGDSRLCPYVRRYY